MKSNDALVGAVRLGPGYSLGDLSPAGARRSRGRDGWRHIAEALDTAGADLVLPPEGTRSARASSCSAAKAVISSTPCTSGRMRELLSFLMKDCCGGRPEVCNIAIEDCCDGG